MKRVHMSSRYSARFFQRYTNPEINVSATETHLNTSATHQTTNAGQTICQPKIACPIEPHWFFCMMWSTKIAMIATICEIVLCLP